MNQYNGLIGTIAEEFNIYQGKTETEKCWKSRVIYSLLGRMGYASLKDIQEDMQLISIVHFKRRIQSVLKSYLAMYPEIQQLYSDDMDGLCNEIYSIFLNTGQIYYSPYRIVASARSIAKVSNIYFTRGMSLEKQQCISGVGTYCFTADKSIVSIHPQDMFQLQENTLMEQWDHLLSTAKWQPLALETKIEYLRIRPPFKYGYWLDSPDTSGVVSLARMGFSGSQIYYLYKFEDDQILGSQLMEWMVDGYSYRSVSNCCLATLGSLPATKYHEDGEIVRVWINYRFPPAELNFMKLYSWPNSYVSLPHDFNRIFDRKVFLAIKDVLTSIGYQFVEE